MKYRLLKDLPWCRAGAIFDLKDREQIFSFPSVGRNELKNFDEWFELVRKPTINDIDWNFDPKPGDVCYFLSSTGTVNSYIYSETDGEAEALMGNRFRTMDEAKAYQKWLKAVAELRRSNFNFKPDWSDSTEHKHFVYYEHGLHISYWGDRCIGTAVYYSTFEDAEQSIREHEQAWLTYFGIEEDR